MKSKVEDSAINVGELKDTIKGLEDTIASNFSISGDVKELMEIVNREFETFVLMSIENRNSFAIETTLRSEITFEQARIAKAYIDKLGQAGVYSGKIVTTIEPGKSFTFNFPVP